jgi:divinyl protochlorophyllide a 8-vinyl-reductase
MKALVFEGSRAGVSSGHAGSSARIGPNAIIQLAAAVTTRLGPDAWADMLGKAGLSQYLDRLPETMVDEREVVALHRTMRSSVAAHLRQEIAYEAGLRTGDYILANRIPKPAQWLLKALPQQLAARALTSAIAKHAWTFAGSGHFRAVSTSPLVLEIEDNPLCRGEASCVPMCDYYAGTFTRLYGALVDPCMTIEESSCASMTGGTCRFEAVLRA